MVGLLHPRWAALDQRVAQLDGKVEHHQCSKEDHVLIALQKRMDSLEYQLRITDKRMDKLGGQVSNLERQLSENQQQQT